MSQWQHSQAAADVIAERARQVEEEGFSPQDDDGYEVGELARAAVSFSLDDFDRTAFSDPTYSMPVFWPWSPDWWKPKDRRSDLVRAAALLIAEIERLDRATGRAAQ